MLPLENLSGDPDLDYLVFGIHEALISDLGRSGTLDKVVGRSSVMAYLQERPPLSEIGWSLGVDAVIEGALQAVGDRISVTARLVDAGTEEMVWANRVEGSLNELLELQAEGDELAAAHATPAGRAGSRRSSAATA